MTFKEYYTKIYDDVVILEAEEGSVQPSDDGLSGSETPTNDGVDILDPDQDSALGNGEGVDNSKIIDLTNILLNSLRFKPSDEFRAYTKMPRFHNLSAVEKLITVRNVLSDHPERIIKEADETLPEDFGGEIEGITETEEMDMLRLIIRAINVNPFAMDITLRELPSEATEDNYMEIVETIEGVLF
jgi:hypothetical protein